MSLNTVGSQPKYGLIQRGVQQKAPPQRRLKASSIFAKDELDDDEDNGPVDFKKEMIQRSLATAKAVDHIAAKAMKEDPNIFDYDGTYDDIQSARNDSLARKFAPTNKEAPKARYIGSLQAASQLREKEQERAFERQLLKERRAEDDLYGDQPKYITAAYKEKLMETKKWELEDKMMEEVEKKHDVRGLGMQGFYANLLTKNLAMGGDVKANAISAYTAGSERQEQVLHEDGRGESSNPPDSSSPARSSSPHTSRHDNDESHSSSGLGKRPRSPSANDRDHEHDRKRTVDEESPESNAKQQRRSSDDSAPMAKAPPAPKKEEIVLSARERYLARKNQQTQPAPASSS